MPQPDWRDWLTQKNLPKLMLFSTGMAIVISGLLYYFTGWTLISAAIAATLIVSDYAALKLLINQTKHK